MSSIDRRRFLALAAASLAAPAWSATIANGRTITMIVSYPAGGGADVMARLVSPRMTDAPRAVGRRGEPSGG